MTAFKFEELGHRLGKMVDAKQAAYGDSFSRAGQVLEILYPHGVPPEKYGDLLAVTRVVDKLFRVATDRDALGESPWRDIAGYGLLGLALAEAEAAKTTEGGEGDR
ncbi:MAG: hypothetical protein GY838_13070 [bacterium]|nr:hypothetical protein [bacterium]